MIILSIKIYENILKFNFLMGGVLDILTVYASFLKRSFIAIKNNEGLFNLWPRQNTFELTLISVNELDPKRWKHGQIHGSKLVHQLISITVKSIAKYIWTER